jgi:hypothetical protein
MKYARSPKKKNRILISDEYGKSYKYAIARNLWLFINMADGEKLDSLPVATVKCMSTVRVNYSSCPAVEEPAATHGFSSYQADYMVLKESVKYEVSEEVWKKIDRLEKYAKEHSDYQIGNRLWLDLEKCLAMLLACEMEISDATDAAITARILPSVAASVKDKLAKEDKTVLQTVEFIFGEDNIQYSKAFLDSLNTVRREKIENATEEAAEDVAEEIAENAELTEEAESASEAVDAETVEVAESEQPVEEKEDNE